jgi:hypothetical protein
MYPCFKLQAIGQTLNELLRQHPKGNYMSSRRVHITGGRSEHDRLIKIQQLYNKLAENRSNLPMRNPIKILREECIDKSTKTIIITNLPEGEHQHRKKELEAWVHGGLDAKQKQEFQVMAEPKLTWAIVTIPDDVDAREWIQEANAYQMNYTTKDNVTKAKCWLHLDTWDEEGFDQLYQTNQYQRNSSCDGTWAIKTENEHEDDQAVTIQGCLIENSEGMPQMLTYKGPKEITRKSYDYNYESKEWNITIHKGKFSSPYEEQGRKDPDFIIWENPSGDGTTTTWYKQKREPLTVAMNDPKRLHLTGLKGIKEEEYIQNIRRTLNTGLNSKRLQDYQKEYNVHHDLERQRVTITFADQHTRDIAIPLLHMRPARNDTMRASVNGEENQYTKAEETEMWKTMDSRSRQYRRPTGERQRSRTPTTHISVSSAFVY